MYFAILFSAEANLDLYGGRGASQGELAKIFVIHICIFIFILYNPAGPPIYSIKNLS
jgi:hypothetical protein